VRWTAGWGRGTGVLGKKHKQRMGKLRYIVRKH